LTVSSVILWLTKNPDIRKNGLANRPVSSEVLPKSITFKVNF